jgi:ATP-dependent 26S proteasome regulatory subunit
MADEERRQALDAYRNKLIESREWEAKLKALRLEIKDLQREYDRTEDNIKALQSVGQIIGEVLKQLDEERCEKPIRAPFAASLELCRLLHVHGLGFPNGQVNQKGC